MSLRILWTPIIGRAIAATSAKTARTLNVAGVRDNGAVNQNKIARITRATTATQSPEPPAMNSRTNETRLEGWKTPYADNRTMITENIASAFAISNALPCGLTLAAAARLFASAGCTCYGSLFGA